MEILVIFLGPPGAGKSQQGRMLAEGYGWKWFSLGNAIRNLNDTKLKSATEKGDLISSETTYEIISQTIGDVVKEKTILDGFPRLKEQAEWLVGSKYNDQVKLVVVFDIPRKEIFNRLKLRGRTDDTNEAIEKRISGYEQTVAEILEVLESAHMPVTHVDGLGTVEQVHDRVIGEFLKWELA